MLEARRRYAVRTLHSSEIGKIGGHQIIRATSTNHWELAFESSIASRLLACGGPVDRKVKPSGEEISKEKTFYLAHSFVQTSIS